MRVGSFILGILIFGVDLLADLLSVPNILNGITVVV